VPIGGKVSLADSPVIGLVVVGTPETP
jgi:hypothetical protein